MTFWVPLYIFQIEPIIILIKYCLIRISRFILPLYFLIIRYCSVNLRWRYIWRHFVITNIHMYKWSTSSYICYICIDTCSKVWDMCMYIYVLYTVKLLCIISVFSNFLTWESIVWLSYELHARCLIVVFKFLMIECILIWY